MAATLLVGAAETDITPPLGTALCGGFSARTAAGVRDPLMAKALVLESGGRRLAYLALDLVLVPRALGDRCVAAASARTGIPPDHIAYAASHTHCAPNMNDLLPGAMPAALNQAWLDGLPDAIARCVAQAVAAQTPCRASRGRAYVQGLSVNRRVRFKDGREINTWLLQKGEEDVQCVGAAGPTDPEIGMLAFEDERGRLRAALFNFAMHAHSQWRKADEITADFPAVVAARLRERYGAQVVTLFAPGASGDLNPTPLSERLAGDWLADAIIGQWDKRRPLADPPVLGALRREISVPCRDLTVDQEPRLKAAQWAPEVTDALRRNLEYLRREGRREFDTRVQAWRIGEVAFAGVPGELFVEWGLHLKQHSPFPWTWPVTLVGDYAGYLVTPRAWEGGGYESLISSCAWVSVEGVERMMHETLALLHTLHQLH